MLKQLPNLHILCTECGIVFNRLKDAKEHRCQFNTIQSTSNNSTKHTGAKTTLLVPAPGKRLRDTVNNLISKVTSILFNTNLRQYGGRNDLKLISNKLKGYRMSFFNTQTQEEAHLLITTSGNTIAFIARKMGLTPQVLRQRLYRNNSISKEFYEDIKVAVNGTRVKINPISELGNIQRRFNGFCEDLIDYYSDMEISSDELRALQTQFHSLSNSFNDLFNKLKVA